VVVVRSECVTLSELLDARRLADAGVDLDREALTDGTDRCSWNDYTDRVARLAGALVAAGVAPGDRVAVHLTKSIDSFVAVHAVIRAGGVMVPVDPLAPAGHAASVITDAGAGVLVTNARPRARRELLGAVTLDTVVLPCDGGRSDHDGLRWVDSNDIAATEPLAAVDVDPEDPAYIIYTSGSTGRPKGIVHTHRSALAYASAAAETYGLGAADRLANIAPLHFDQSTFELYAGPLAGAAVVIVPDPVLRFPASVADLVEQERPTVWYSVPLLLTQLSARGELAGRDLSSLRWVLFGGEAFSPGRLAELMGHLPTASFSNVYGPAEVNQCTAFEVAAAPTTDAPIPIGRAWRAAELRVVDDASRPLDPAAVVEPGSPGILLVSSPTMMSGYWNRPELTAESVLADPTEPERRWYATGDLVVEDASGTLTFLGRVDNQVKVRGYRVELEAVDGVLRDVEGVTEATSVVDRRDELAERIVAIVVTDPSFDDDAVVTGARSELRRRLPGYSVPSEIIVADELPLTGTGKVDRRAAARVVEP